MQSLVTSNEIRKSAHAKLAWALPLLVATALGVGFVNLYLLPAVAAFVCLICLAIAFPERMFLFALACSILVSVEIGVKLGALPRIGLSLTVLAALLLGAVLHCGSRFDREQIAAIFAQVPMIRLWIVYILFLLASAALSINRQASYYSATKEILLQFALVLLLSYFLRDPRFWPRLRTVLFLATAFACFYAVAEEITHYNIFLSFYPTEELVMRGDILRVRSTFFHPIAFGTYLALIYPFLVVDVVKRRRPIYMVLLVLLLLAMFLTVSRGPWLSLIIETAFLAFLLVERKYRVTGAVILIVGMLTCFAVAQNELWPANLPGEAILNPGNLGHGPVNEASSEYYRFAVVRAALDRLEGARWVYGFGPGTFYMADVRSEYAGQDHVLTAGDCQYALTLVEIGTVGLGIMIVMMTVGVLICARAVSRTFGNRRMLASACLASVVGFVFNCGTASMFQLFPLNLLFWMGVVLASSLTKAEALEMRL